MIYEKNGRFSLAGDLRKKLAEELESESDFAKAIEQYKKAADYYEMEKANSKNNHQICLLKAADLMCLSDHKDAFEECKQDYVSGDAFLSKFLNEDPSMYDSNEHILLKEFIESIKEKNLLRFKTAITKYKSTNDLDKWKLHMFTKIMNKIEKENNNMEDIDDFK